MSEDNDDATVGDCVRMLQEIDQSLDSYVSKQDMKAWINHILSMKTPLPKGTVQLGRFGTIE